MAMKLEGRKHSRVAVHRAMSSIHADRLQEIAVEHIRLSRQAGNIRHMSLKQASAIFDQIEQLRSERDEILSKFEQEGNDDI